MKYGFYLSPCGEHIAYYYFDEDDKRPALQDSLGIQWCIVGRWLEESIMGWIYLGE